MKLRLITTFVALVATLSFSQVTILDDFETGLGHFNLQTNYSGSTVGVIGTTPTIDSSTAHWGMKSLRIVFIDDPAQSVNWAVRFLSGTGTPANNIEMAPTGWTGYWLKTNRPWLRTSALIDAPGTAEVGDTLNVAGDDQWHYYQWNLGQDGQPMWKGWVTGNDTISDDPTPTYDAIWFFAPDGSDTTVVFLDFVVWNPNGQIPVELRSFTAAVDKNNVDLRWITATETNNKGFEVQRRSESSNYETIGFVQGNGTTSELHAYTFSDVVKNEGNYTYRLKQIDFDGTYELSNEVYVDIISIPGEYVLAQNFPNPFNPNTNIRYSLPENGIVNLSIFNVLGQKVAELVNQYQNAGEYSVDFTAHNFSSGNYIYVLSVNGNTITKKMTLLK